MAKRGTVSVVGQGRVEGAPDVCRARLAVTALRSGVAAALEDSERAVRRVRDALAANGVAPRDAPTGTVSVSAEEDWSGQRRRLLGYRAEHALSVALRDLAAAGRVLGEAVAAGGDDVRLLGLEFALEDDTAVRAQARELAWRDAERTARQLAELAGRELGGVRRVEVLGGQSSFPPGPRRYAAMAADAGGGAEIGLEPGQVGVRVALAVVWELA